LRQAVKLKVPKGHGVDTVLFENYQRVSPDRGYGFNVFGDKTVHPKVTVSGGFAHIDRSLIANADRFPPGNRVYGAFVWRIRPDLTLNPVFIRAIGPLNTPTTHRTRFDLILTWNFLAGLKAKGWL
jgi:hypothetical protein